MEFEKWKIDTLIDIAKRGTLTVEGQQNCAKLIEALQQEIDSFKVFTGEIEPNEQVIALLQSNRNELIKWIARCVWHCRKVNELDKVNQQLHAQAAALREALIELKSIFCNYIKCPYEYCRPECESYSVVKKANEALASDAGKDYHNPIDVEVLKLAKEALELIYNKHTDITNHHKYPRTCVICREALTAIEKALGGNGDGI